MTNLNSAQMKEMQLEPVMAKWTDDALEFAFQGQTYLRLTYQTRLGGIGKTYELTNGSLRIAVRVADWDTATSEDQAKTMLEEHVTRFLYSMIKAVEKPQ